MTDQRPTPGPPPEAAFIRDQMDKAAAAIRNGDPEAANQILRYMRDEGGPQVERAVRQLLARHYPEWAPSDPPAGG